MRGLPPNVTACLLDLDGVLTDTASVHDGAWTEVFDALLAARGLAPFDPVEDYLTHVDGKPRADGVRDFLASRGISLPEGGPDDPPGQDTVAAVGNAKNALLLERIERDGVDVYEGSRTFLRAAADEGLLRAVVSSSANTAQVLEVTGLASLVQTRVDGVTARDRGLPGKPDPATFLAAAADLGVEPGACVVVEDAASGVAAGRAGGFGLVVGVDRTGRPGHAQALRDAGADVVVGDLAELL